MAATDKFTLIYLVADILTAVRRAREALALDVTRRSSKRPPPEAYRHLQVILPLVELTLDKVQKRAANDQLDPIACHSLITSAEACKHKVEELGQVLRKARPRSTRERVKMRFRPTVRRELEQRVRQIADEIVECDVRIATAGEIAPDEEDVTALVFDKEVKMDIHFDDIVRRMV